VERCFDGRGETLLVVDDEVALRDVAGRILSGAGYHVLAADGGSKALELAALHDGAIDLLLLASRGTHDPGVALLEKPFTAEDLLAAVRRRLDGID
jgi:two-component system, cell cycle sensor histidine kinase and response regulator CckA